MTPADREAARAALNQGRATHARLDQIRSPEDAAADIIDLWSAAESAMRAMLGGTGLSGQALLRELRQRDMLTLEQANALASFWSARTRVDDVGYQPTLTDVGYARAGYNQLANAIEAAGVPAAPTLGSTTFQNEIGTAAAPPRASSPGAPAQTGVPRPSSGPSVPARTRRLSPPILIGGVVVAIILLALAAYLVFGRSSYNRAMAAGVDLMRSGQTEAARAQFSRAAQEHPDRAEPHVFLARLARNDGDIATARQELETAIRTDPSSAVADREMGLLLLSQNNAELARRFLVRAVQLAPTDSAAQGYLGCTLLKLNRLEEGERFLSRAGPGSWSSCATLPPATGAGTLPAGMPRSVR